MDRSSALSKLATLTSGLKPAGTSTPADLDTVRAALAASLLAHTVDPTTAVTGLPTAPATSPSAEDLAALDRILDTAAAAPSAAPVPLVFPRGLPAVAVGNPALTPAAVAGMLPQSIGPFVDSLGALHWFDLFPPVQQTAIMRAPSTTPLLLLPLAIPAGPVPKKLPVAAGTAWIEAQLLASGSPAGGYAGIAITGGALTFSTAVMSTAAGIEVPAATTVTLTLTLGGEPGPTGGGEPGADGGAAVASVPAEVTFVFTSSGGQITAAGDASLTAYGSTIGLSFEAAAPVFEAALGQILVPFAPQSPTFTVQSVLSDLFQPSGTAPIVGAAWALPVAVTPPAQLGAAASAGLLLLELGPGLLATWQGSTGGPARFDAVALECAGGMLALLARTFGLGQPGLEIDLWSNAPPSTAHSEIDVTFPSGTLTYFISIASFAGASHVEIASSGAIIAAHIDRPVAADGGHLGPTLPGTLAIYQTASLNGVLISALRPASPAPPPPIALALRNALLVTTPPGFLLAAGTFSATPTELDSGGLLLAFEIENLLPTLPDPYAANFLPSLPYLRDNQQPVGGEASVAAATPAVLLAVVLWTPAKTLLAFFDSGISRASLQVAKLTKTQQGQSFGATGQQDATWQSELENMLDNVLGSESPQLFLLDVSSNVDQLGVGMAVARPDTRILAGPGGSGDILSIAGLDLVAPTQDLRVMTVPAVQWEPVVTIQNPKVLPYPFPSPAGFLDDGGPTLWGANDVTLVPVAPAPLFTQVMTSYDGGKAAGALFTLPFGMAAVVAIPQRPKIAPPLFFRPGLTKVQPSFSPQNMSGGLQMSMTAPVSIIKTTDSPSLPGATVQKRNLVDQFGNPVLDPPTPGGTPLSVLGPAVDEVFNSEFNPEVPTARVPLERIDFSGYGASSFSDWSAPDAVPPAVVQVSFKTIVGRTSHEVVQVKSVLYPCCAIVVRTITIDRQDSSEVSRYDSGWIPVTPGLFKTPGITIHAGAVTGMYNIREITDTTQTYKSGSVEMVGVYFDTDVQIDGLLRGASNGMTPSTGQFGFVQTAPANTPLTAAQLADLITSQGSLGGPVDCVISVAGTTQTMRVTRVEVDNAPHAGVPETHEFAAAARGSVVLPQPGSWSVLERTDTVSEPTPIDPDLGVPLIRQGPAGGPPSTSPWRLAEPVDLWVPDAPSMDYCLLHSTDSTRMLFPRPQIANGATAFTSDQTPLLADGFALMGATSVCPRQDSCLTFPNANYALQIGGSGDFTLANVPASFAPSMPSRTLATQSAGVIGFEYADDTGTQAHVSAAISPTSWSVGLQGINVRVDIGPFTGIMRTVGNVNASSASGVAFNNGKLVLGSVLEPLQQLLSFLAQLGLPNPLSLAFSNSGWNSTTSYKLKAGLTFTVPSVYLPALWIFLKQPTDSPPGVMPFSASVSLKVGFGNAVSGPAAQAGALMTNSSQWAAYLSVTGTFQWEVWPPFPVKVGFLLGFSIQINFPAGSTPGSTQLTFQLGGIISIGGSLGPIISASASVSVVFSVVVTETGSASVTLGLMLIISASGKILGGLIGITFTAEAGGSFTLTSPQSFQATFDVSIDVQLCWVLDVSFDASIQFSHQLSA